MNHEIYIPESSVMHNSCVSLQFGQNPNVFALKCPPQMSSHVVSIMCGPKTDNN